MSLLDEIIDEIKVYNSKDEVKSYDPKKIFNSLLKETDISSENAEKITVETTKLILNIPYLTAPLIREFVCISLIKNGFYKERFQYTRIGMPYYDYKNLIESSNGIDEKVIQTVNKEFVEVSKWIKERIK